MCVEACQNANTHVMSTGKASTLRAFKILLCQRGARVNLQAYTDTGPDRLLAASLSPAQWGCPSRQSIIEASGTNTFGSAVDVGATGSVARTLWGSEIEKMNVMDIIHSALPAGA